MKDDLQVETMLGTILGALYQDAFSTGELEQLGNAVKEAIARKQHKEEEDRRQAFARQSRQQFINRVIDFGRTQKLNLSVEQLHEIGEYLYDTQVLGKTSEQVIQTALHRRAH
ncbi:MAG: hypothetical protein OHK0046_10610 [Anaerolineae bacterium]